MGLEMIAQRPIVNLTINGQKTNFFKLGMGDIADVTQMIKDDYENDLLEKAKRIYGEVPEDIQKKAMDGLTDKEVAGAMSNPKYGIYLIWCSIKATYPTMTLEEASNILSVEDIEKIGDAISPKEKKRGPVKKQAKK